MLVFLCEWLDAPLSLTECRFCLQNCPCVKSPSSSEDFIESLDDCEPRWNNLVSADE
uniref:Uncharacterized protein n=1 Tax=Arundo donax TaxID=35708 RepID=A0A0A9JF36_ARUDO